MEHLLKMRNVELAFKDFVGSAPCDLRQRAFEVQEIHTLIENSDPKYHPLLLSNYTYVLPEDYFFDPAQDVAAFQHYRYMPASYHEHEFFELACVLSGSFTNYTQGTCLTLVPGDVMIMAPHIRHAVSTFADDGIMINILIRSSTFEQNFMNALPQNDLLRNFFVNTLYKTSTTPYLLFKTGKDPQLQAYILSLSEESRRNRRYRNTMLTAMTSIFLALLLRNHEKDLIFPNLKPTSKNENTIFILQYMQKHYDTITLSHLAGFFNYSERQIQRIILAATGVSFRENILMLRMAHAAEKLKNTGLTISDIASSVGYYDASNFRHIFKKYYGTTPQQYRNEHA